MQFLTLVGSNLPQLSSQNGPNFKIEEKQMPQLFFSYKIVFLLQISAFDKHFWEDRLFMTLLSPKWPPECLKIGLILKIGKNDCHHQDCRVLISASYCNFIGSSHWLILLTCILLPWTERAQFCHWGVFFF